MSKEMTPKDALRRISGFISFCCYEYFDKELEKEWKKDIDAITQALERLELLEKVIKILKDKVTFRWRNDDILEIVKYVWQNNSPRIEILTNYEEDELLKEVLE